MTDNLAHNKFKSVDYNNESEEEEDFDEVGDLGNVDNDDDDDDLKNSGQILWIRGLSRLQTQVMYLFDYHNNVCLFRLIYHLNN